MIKDEDEGAMQCFYKLIRGEKLEKNQRSLYIALVDKELTIYEVLEKYISYIKDDSDASISSIYVNSSLAKEDFKTIDNAIKAYNEIKKNTFAGVLTEDERKYLKSVVEPFRENVKCIFKSCLRIGSFTDKEAKIGIERPIKIEIVLKNSLESIFIPITKSGMQFAGMKNGVSYSLEELGL